MLLSAKFRRLTKHPALLTLALLVAACGESGGGMGPGGDGSGGPDPDPDPDPDPGATGAVVFSGPGAAELVSTDFTVDQTFIDGTGNLIWINNDVTRAAATVQLQAFPSPIDPTKATSVSLFSTELTPKAWLTFDINGVPGVTINGSTLTFTDVVVTDAILGRPAVTINGSLTVPTTTLLPPAAPGGVTVTPQNGNLQVSWNAVTEADTYNIYVARQPGVTPANFQGLTGGQQFTDVSSPFTFPGGLPAGIPHYVVVSAANAAGESGASTEASGTPTGTGADPGSLTLSGTGAALLPSTNFAPDNAGPGTTDPAENGYSWVDHANTQGLLQIIVLAGDTDKAFLVRFTQGSTTWSKGDFFGLPEVTRNGDAFTVTGLDLPEQTGGSSTLTLNGTVNAVLVTATPPTGSLTLSGPGVGDFPSTTFTPTSVGWSQGSLYMYDDLGVELRVRMETVAYGSSTYVALNYNGIVLYQKLESVNPIPGVATTGTGVSFTATDLLNVFGTSNVTVDGSLTF